MKAVYADDDPVVRVALGTVLARLGHQAIEARDGEEAWQVYRALRPSLAILDIDMPARGGLDVCRMVREADSNRDTFVLLLTERGSEQELLAILDAGADDYMMKPASIEAFHVRLAIADRRIRQEAARRRADADLQRARWLAGVGEAMITLQHEINNPLAALLGHAELLLMDTRERGEPNEQVETIFEQARRIAAVVRKLAELQNPRSVEYVAGARMIDLNEQS